MLSKVFRSQSAKKIGRAMGLGKTALVEIAEAEGGHCIVAHARDAYVRLVVKRDRTSPIIQHWQYDRIGTEITLRELDRNGQYHFVHYWNWDEEAGTVQCHRHVEMHNRTRAANNLLQLVHRTERATNFRLI